MAEPLQNKLVLRLGPCESASDLPRHSAGTYIGKFFNIALVFCVFLEMNVFWVRIGGSLCEFFFVRFSFCFVGFCS